MGNQRCPVVVFALLAIVHKTGGQTDATDAYTAAVASSDTGEFCVPEISCEFKTFANYGQNRNNVSCIPESCMLEPPFAVAAPLFVRAHVYARLARTVSFVTFACACKYLCKQIGDSWARLNCGHVGPTPP